MNFGQKVRDARKKLGLNQSELAELVGTTRRTVNSYENGRTRPKSLQGFEKLADVLGVRVNWLLSVDERLSADGAGDSRAPVDAGELLDMVNALFTGGQYSEEYKDRVMRKIQEIYWDSRERSAGGANG